MVRITMLNGDQYDLPLGSVANERRWCKAYLLNDDVVSTTLFFTDTDGLSKEENYGKDN